MKAFVSAATLLVAVALAVFASSSAPACTGITITPRDGSVIFARTLEFASDMQSNILVVPRGREYVGTAPGDKSGLRWTIKYGVVGANAFGMPVTLDGLNEKGLHVGLFYFATCAHGPNAARATPKPVCDGPDNLTGFIHKLAWGSEMIGDHMEEATGLLTQQRREALRIVMPPDRTAHVAFGDFCCDDIAVPKIARHRSRIAVTPAQKALFSAATEGVVDIAPSSAVGTDDTDHPIKAVPGEPPDLRPETVPFDAPFRDPACGVVCRTDPFALRTAGGGDAPSIRCRPRKQLASADVV